MVVISLYRGNLHRKVPEVPRRWLMPTPTISLRDFRLLLLKRNAALARLRNQNQQPGDLPIPIPIPIEDDATATATATATAAAAVNDDEGMADINNNNNNSNNNNLHSQPHLKQISKAPIIHHDRLEEEEEEEAEEEKVQNADEETTKGEVANIFADYDHRHHPESELKEVDGQLQKLDVSAPVPRNHHHQQQEKPLVLVQTPQDVKVDKDLDALSDKERRKVDLEKKLNVLNEEKHHLVQMLKQILNAEEEMKKRYPIQTQSSGVRAASVPLHVEATATIDTGSVTRKAAPPRMIEVNYGGGELGGAESEDVSNNLNTTHHARHLQHRRSTSPFAASPLQWPMHSISLQHNNNMVLQLSKANMGGGGGGSSQTASPSRFAAPTSPIGLQGDLVAPLSVPAALQQPMATTSLSPVAAASSGTSRRLTSPSWSQR